MKNISPVYETHEQYTLQVQSKESISLNTLTLGLCRYLRNMVCRTEIRTRAQRLGSRQSCPSQYIT